MPGCPPEGAGEKGDPLSAKDFAESLASGALNPAEARLPHGIDLRQVAQEALAHIRVSVSAAASISEFVAMEARRAGDRLSRGVSERLKGHVLLMGGRPAKAIPCYRRAAKLLRDHPEEKHATAAGFLQALAYTGAFEEAFAVAEEASAYFLSTGDELRAARIIANKANALHRMDRHQEASEAYETALSVLKRHDAASDAAIVMRNYASSLMSLLELERADSLFTEARAFFEERGMTQLVVEIDLNRAYLLGRRGRTREALTAWRQVQQQLDSEESRGFEAGHCLLDQADLMLEAGLWRDAELAAQTAAAAFADLDLPFEERKAALIAYRARTRLGRLEDDGSLARLFRREDNKVWKSLFIQARAERLSALGNWAGGAKLLERAVGLLEGSQSRERLLEALALLAEAKAQSGQDVSSAADHPLVEGAGPAIKSRLAAADALGRKRSGAASSAFAGARRALDLFDQARAAGEAAALRQAARASLDGVLATALECLEDPGDRLNVVRRMKNQTLAELIQSPEAAPPDSEVRALRESLFALNTAEDTNALAREEREARWEAAARRLSLAGGAAIQAQPALTEAALPPSTRAVEFFVSSGRLRALVVQAGQVREQDLASERDLAQLARMLRLQLGRGLRGGPDGASRILEQCGAMAAPVWSGLERGSRLLLCPSPQLGSIPLHALPAGGGPLFEAFQVSCAPSLDSWLALLGRPSGRAEGVVVAAAPDSRAPRVAQEEQALAALGAESLEMQPDPVAAVSRAAQGCRWLHLAGHGLHREDRPLMSSMMLGGQEMSAWDVSRMTVNADLVSLSGCATGVSALAETLDSQGLIEAFLYAGARQVVASMWDVGDEAAARLMAAFGARLAGGADPHQALRQSVAELRAEMPHPVHWAAFWIFGDFSGGERIFPGAARPRGVDAAQ